MKFVNNRLDNKVPTVMTMDDLRNFWSLSKPLNNFSMTRLYDKYHQLLKFIIEDQMQLTSLSLKWRANCETNFIQYAPKD